MASIVTLPTHAFPPCCWQVDTAIDREASSEAPDEGDQALIAMRQYRPRSSQAIAEQVEQCLDLSEPGQEVSDLIGLIRSQAQPWAMIQEVLQVPE